MECTLGQTRHTKSCWLRKGEPNEAFQLPAGYLKWLGVEAQWRFSDTLSILAQRHMSGPGVMGCWTSQTMQNAAVCFEEGHQNRCCNLRAGGSCFKCVNPMWRSDCSSVLVSNQVPPFARQSLVAKWKWLRVPSQKANRWKALEAPASSTRQRPGFMPCGPSLAKPVSTRYTKNMCHFGFQACQRDKTGSNCKSQLRCSFPSGVDSWCWAPFWNCQFPTCPTTISKMSVPRTSISY